MKEHEARAAPRLRFSKEEIQPENLQITSAKTKKAMKKACGSLRIDLAQYREMAVFTEFSSDLDKATQDQLTNGRVLMELLKQPLGHPLSMADEVITLVVGTNRIMMDVEPAKVKEFQNAMLSSFRSRHPEIVEGIRREGNLTDDMKESILKYGKEFHDQWMAEQSGEEKAAGKAIESAAVQKA